MGRMAAPIMAFPPPIARGPRERRSTLYCPRPIVSRSRARMAPTRASVDSPPFARTLAPPAASHLCLLGKPALRAGNRHVALRLRPKAVALIAYLAVENREVSRHDIARL